MPKFLKVFPVFVSHHPTSCKKRCWRGELRPKKLGLTRVCRKGACEIFPTTCGMNLWDELLPNIPSSRRLSRRLSCRFPESAILSFLAPMPFPNFGDSCSDAIPQFWGNPCGVDESCGAKFSIRKFLGIQVWSGSVQISDGSIPRLQCQPFVS